MKIDLEVKKQATINTGNYSSIQPSVNIRLKDVDVGKTEKVYENLNIISTALFIKELYILSEVQNELKNLGIKEFFEKLEMDEVKTDFKNAIKELHDDIFMM